MADSDDVYLDVYDNEQLAIGIQESLKTYGHDRQVEKDPKMAQVLEESLDQIGTYCIFRFI